MLHLKYNNGSSGISEVSTHSRTPKCFDSLHQHARVLKDQIDVATAETINSIDITTGW